jgi:hypothetical protein
MLSAGTIGRTASAAPFQETQRLGRVKWLKSSSTQSQIRTTRLAVMVATRIRPELKVKLAECAMAEQRPMRAIYEDALSTYLRDRS